MSVSSRRGRTLAAALFLSTALSTVALAPPVLAQSPAQLRAARDAFINSGYNYCDAKMVGAAWGQSPDRGKIEIGLKINGGFSENLASVLQQSRDQGNACSWEDTQLEYRDAQALAAVWGMGTPYEAKQQAAAMYTQGNAAQVASDLGR